MFNNIGTACHHQLDKARNGVSGWLNGGGTGWSMAQDFQWPIMAFMQSKAMAPPAQRARALISKHVIPSLLPITLQLV